MAINIQSYGSCIGTSTGTSTLTINGTNNISTGYSWVDHNKDVKDFVEFVLEILGIKLKFEDFVQMSESDKISFLRDYKLNQILKNKED